MLVVDKVLLAFVVVAGILSAAGLARDVWGVDLHPVLDSTLEIYDGWLDRIWGSSMFDAAPYWEHVSNLLWLVFASYAWSVTRWRPLPRAVFAWICSFAFALLGGVLAGMGPPLPNLILWPLVSIAAFVASQALYELRSPT
jgi:hypothetical protein